MLLPLSDLVLRIGRANPEELRRIFVAEISAPIWTAEERRILTNAFDNRATALNAEDIDLSVRRWRQGAA